MSVVKQNNLNERSTFIIKTTLTVEDIQIKVIKEQIYIFD